MAASISPLIPPTAAIMYTFHHSARGLGDRWYATIDSNATYSDPVTGAQISVSLEVSGFGNAYGELDFVSVLSANDPALGTLYGGLGNGYGCPTYDESGGAFHVERPTTFGYGTHDISEYYSFAVDSNLYCNVGCTLSGYFDGTNGVATGSWYVTYTVPAVAATPEPAVTLQLALGGLCLLLARIRQRRRNVHFLAGR